MYPKDFPVLSSTWLLHITLTHARAGSTGEGDTGRDREKRPATPAPALPTPRPPSKSRIHRTRFQGAARRVLARPGLGYSLPALAALAGSRDWRCLVGLVKTLILTNQLQSTLVIHEWVTTPKNHRPLQVPGRQGGSVSSVFSKKCIRLSRKVRRADRGDHRKESLGWALRGEEGERASRMGGWEGHEHRWQTPDKCEALPGGLHGHLLLHWGWWQRWEAGPVRDNQDIKRDQCLFLAG